MLSKTAQLNSAVSSFPDSMARVEQSFSSILMSFGVWWPSYEVHYHWDPRSPQLETKLEDCCNFVSALAPDIDDNDGVTRGPVPGTSQVPDQTCGRWPGPGTMGGYSKQVRSRNIISVSA